MVRLSNNADQIGTPDVSVDPADGGTGSPRYDSGSSCAKRGVDVTWQTASTSLERADILSRTFTTPRQLALNELAMGDVATNIEATPPYSTLLPLAHSSLANDLVIREHDIQEQAEQPVLSPVRQYSSRSSQDHDYPCTLPPRQSSLPGLPARADLPEHLFW